MSATVEGVTFELSPAFRADPVSALESALIDVSRALGGDTRLLLAWDEVPDTVLGIIGREGAGAAAKLLAVLRRFRDGPAAPSIRWLVTGSVGFHHALRDLERGDALVNDLDNLPLEPLSHAWAVWLAASLLAGAGVQADDAAAEELARVSGGIPYLSHLIAKEARDRRLTSLEADDVEPLFDRAVNDLDQSQHATHFLSRLDDYYGEWAPIAEWILDRVVVQPSTRTELEAAASQAGVVLASPDQLRIVLNWLTLDHYIANHGGPAPRYEWRYAPLARIWRIRRS